MAAQFPAAMDALWKRAVGAADDASFAIQSGTQFDLTLKFEETVLTIPPTALVLLLTPFYLWYYFSSPVVTTQEPLLWGKQAGSVTLVVLQVVAAVLCISPDDATETAKTASLMACLAAVATTFFLHFEHRRAVQSSPVSSLYLTFMMFLNIVKARSYFLRGERLYATGSLTAAAAAVMFVLVILGELPKRYRCEKKVLGKEATHGFWSRTLFLWLNSTLFFGFRNTLSLQDLPNLGPNFSSERLVSIFEPVWMKRATSSLRLMAATLWTLAWSFVSVVPPRLLYIAFSYSQPFIIKSILEAVHDEDESDDFRNGLIGAMALAHVGIALTRVWFNHMNTRMITKTRGVLISQIIRKTFLLEYEEARMSAALTLMSTDLEGISRVLPKIHEAWAGLVELAVGIYLLSSIVKEASILVIIPALVSTAISIDLGRRSRIASSDWNDKTDKRVAKTSRILSQIKGIKMSANEHSVADYIQYMRDAEITQSKRARRLNVLAHAAAPIGYTFTPILVLCGGLFGPGFENGFSATEAFTTLAFIYLASQPMMTILTSWSRLGSLVACFGRIQHYLLLEERVDCRQKRAQKGNCKLVSSGPTVSELSDSTMRLVESSFSFVNSTQTLLQASVLFGRATTTMIRGATGSGKSTLLKAFLGDAKIFGGSIFVDSDYIAYCGQDTWIRNVTVRKNIIGAAKYDKEWYKTIVRICHIGDIDKLPRGHLTLAGSRGSNLSGGQKQRIALARALYIRAPVLLLDDITSAIDLPTASLIMDALLGPDGLLKKLGTTVVMVTHTAEFLKFADQILTIPGDGKITTEAGTESLDADASRGESKDNNTAISDVVHQDDAENPIAAAAEASELEESSSLRQEGDFTLYTYYLKSVSIFTLSVWIFVTAVVAVLERMPDIFIRIWVEKDPNNKKYFIGYALLGFGGILSVAAWTWLYFMHIIPQSAGRLHRQLLDTVKTATLSFLTHTDFGSILNRFSQDMSLISQDLPMAFLFFLYTLLVALTNLAILSAAAPYAAVLLPLVLGLLLVLQHYYLRTSRQMRLLDLEAKTPLYSHLTEVIDGLQHIHAFGWEENFLKEGLALLDNSQKPYYYMYCIQRWLSLVLDLSVAAITVILVALALNMRSTKQAALGLGLLHTMQMGPELADLIDVWTELETSLGALSRLRTFCKETPSEQIGGEGSENVPENWPHRGDVIFTNVSSEYAVPGNNSHKALCNVSVDIAGGTKVGIVGRTGSGKSSLLLTTLNFLIMDGRITIDGVDITTIPQQTLRSRITTISQDMVDLPSSVRDNLLPGEMNRAKDDQSFKDEALMEVLVQVGLGEHVRGHGGLDEELDKMGLSTGQKQLLAMARALLHNQQTRSKIVLVDEATSSIDYAVEERMQAIMAVAFKDCTVLTVAHRIETLAGVDVVLRMDGGSLVSDEDDGEGGLAVGENEDCA